MKRELEEARRQKYVGVVELADEAARILAQRAPVQERATVTEVTSSQGGSSART